MIALKTVNLSLMDQEITFAGEVPDMENSDPIQWRLFCSISWIRFLISG
jgi:hypothetical protein